MAESGSISGPSAAPTSTVGATRGIAGAVDGGQGGRDGGGRAATAGARAGDAEPPAIIRFQGQALDPMAPRGTYLDITV